MADYYSLLSRAVEGIPPSMPGARQALYERARKILFTELAGGAPKTEADIAAERRLLEAAITRVEGELTEPPIQKGAESSSLSRASSQSRAAGGAAAGASLAVRDPIPPPSSPQEKQEKPTLTELMRIVDDAMKEPAALPPVRRAEYAVAPTPSNRTAPANTGSGRAAGVVRALQPLRERRPSATPELQVLIGRSAQPEQERPAPNKTDIDRILRNLQVASPGIEASALISKSGLMIASAMAPRMDETRVAGVTATLLKLGGRASVELARGEVQELVVRADRGYAVMIGAGQGALLLALANESSKLGYIFFGMQETIKALEHVL